jgi:hypothetical protein
MDALEVQLKSGVVVDTVFLGSVSWGKKEWRHANLLRHIGLRVRTSRPCPHLLRSSRCRQTPGLLDMKPGVFDDDRHGNGVHTREELWAALSLAFFPVPRPRFWGTEPKWTVDAPLSVRHVYSCTPDNLNGRTGLRAK